jgi:hypothetical protein
MPNLYFWEPEQQNHGILHAVLAWDECDRVLGCASATCLGAEFPTGSRNSDSPARIAILYVHPEEANQLWVAGFYRVDADAMKIHEALGNLKQIPTTDTGTNAQPSS